MIEPKYRVGQLVLSLNEDDRHIGLVYKIELDKKNRYFYYIDWDDGQYYFEDISESMVSDMVSCLNDFLREEKTNV